GLTLVEALRQGVPVLASDSYGARHLVRPDYGRVVNIEGRDGARRLRGALGAMLRDGERLAAMREAALRAGREMDFARAATGLRDLIAGTLG
ncbi:MAG: glycosyltransferase, partial [Nitrospinota bacterium]